MDVDLDSYPTIQIHAANCSKTTALNDYLYDKRYCYEYTIIFCIKALFLLGCSYEHTVNTKYMPILWYLENLKTCITGFNVGRFIVSKAQAEHHEVREQLNFQQKYQIMMILQVQMKEIKPEFIKLTLS